MSYQQPGGDPQPDAPVDRDVHGLLQGVEARSNGWMRFLILEPGKQYPVKCDTKQQESINAAMSLMNQPVSAQVREQPSTNINPNTNRPYVNRYLNAIALQGAGGYQQQPQQQPQQQQQPMQQQQQPQYTPQGHGADEREMQIMRQAAAKEVAMSLAVLPIEQRTPAGMVGA